LANLQVTMTSQYWKMSQEEYKSGKQTNLSAIRLLLEVLLHS